MSKLSALVAGTALTLSAGALAHNHGDAPASAYAEMIDSDGDTVGQIHLRQGPNGVLFSLELRGLEPGMKAIHIHSVGTCDDHEHGFQDSSGHLNPDDKQHGLMNPEGPDAGDLNNFYVHTDGYARAELFNERVSLDGSRAAALLGGDGTALVIHENPDDHYSQPIGGAGARIACGVIVGD
ncbi:superoxide dismutase family protein [Marinimicrobium alkaliphilum]|uniref:superoxide dismutase family protein n=1 Tax=Marinimicrobium alkaliphilum TaxID=2202654 RepID=UPI000DBAC4D1|nr:superoxide dismutase family protein [Marinimicrobium alkaliphilum]